MNVLIKEKRILKNENKLCPYKKFSVFYNSCLKMFGLHLVRNGPGFPTKFLINMTGANFNFLFTGVYLSLLIIHNLTVTAKLAV
jgi:hypothetical protein